MPSEKGAVHIIDDDDALRDSLAFLLRTARIEVATPRQRLSWRKLRTPS
jgi:FixJ family two-component response regulator